MIFIDSNIPMYLVGADPAWKAAAKQLLERCITEHEQLVTDAEVLQEILHRYVAINRRDQIQPAFDALLRVVDDVFAVDLAIVDRARAIVLMGLPLSARDAVHVAAMERNGVRRIMSFDTAFDGFPGIERLSE